jgi:hypothetical protein
MWPDCSRLVLTLAITGAIGATEPAWAEPDLAFLAEAVCEAAPGAPLEPLVLSLNCVRPRLRGLKDVVSMQRHDWPAAHEAAQRPQGYQRSNSYIVRDRSGRWLAVQTFDFGGGDRRFGVFDGGRGDGGQVAAISGGAAHVTMTEDGSGGVQWFTGSACRGEMEATRSGWLLFSQRREASWRESVASLRITRTSAECPTTFDRSFTRWREMQIDWPVLFNGRRDEARPALTQLATIISEHFGGQSDSGAGHMERFYLAAGAGLVRWERWEQAGVSKRPQIDQRAERLTGSGRCPEIDGSAAPGDSWRRIDCRMWTNFVDAAEPASQFDWREALGGQP